MKPLVLLVGLVAIALTGCASYEPTKKLTELKIGQSRVIAVRANDPYNESGIKMEKGIIYKIEIEFEAVPWEDWNNRVTETGYDHFGQPLARKSDAKIFSLVGEIAGTGVKFNVPKRSKYLAPASGEAIFYANDVPGMYFNNEGVMYIRVKAYDKG